MPRAKPPPFSPPPDREPMSTAQYLDAMRAIGVTSPTDWSSLTDAERVKFRAATDAYIASLNS